VTKRPINGTAREPDIEETMEFQSGARAADVGVAEILRRAQEAGIDPRAVASGALMAVIRYHLQWLNVPRTERAVLSVLIPAIGKSTRHLISMEEAK
jgi:hypothetical protein